MDKVPEPAEVTDFWFGELQEGLADDFHRKRWFTPDPAFDRHITERFGSLLTAARGGELTPWTESPRHALALVILCDQFSRQIHRGSSAAYESDALALATARGVIEAGDDLTLALDERAFLYMPFQHSELRLDQHTSVGLYSALREVTPPGRRQLVGQYLRHAQQHRDIVLRFGRFPHRNRVLGRTSTPEEVTFLESASDYGQTAPSR